MISEKRRDEIVRFALEHPGLYSKNDLAIRFDVSYETIKGIVRRNKGIITRAERGPRPVNGKKEWERREAADKEMKAKAQDLITDCPAGHSMCMLNYVLFGLRVSKSRSTIKMYQDLGLLKETGVKK